MASISGFILAGGSSSRMGSDKALLAYKRSTFIETIIGNLMPIFSSVAIIGNRPEYTNFGVPVLADVIKDIGPLGGILTGLNHSSDDLNFFIPCDMPMLGTTMISRIIFHGLEKEGVIPVVAGKKQLLSAVYHRNVVNKLKKNIENGNRKVSLFVKELDIVELNVAEEDRLNFLNVNSKDDLKLIV